MHASTCPLVPRIHPRPCPTLVPSAPRPFPSRRLRSVKIEQGKLNDQANALADLAKVSAAPHSGATEIGTLLGVERPRGMCVLVCL